MVSIASGPRALVLVYALVLSFCGGVHSQGESAEYARAGTKVSIRLRSGTHVADSGVDPRLVHVAPGPSGRRHAILIIHASLSQSGLDELSRVGIRPLAPISSRGWLVTSDSNTKWSDPNLLRVVRAAFPLDAETKIHPKLTKDGDPTAGTVAVTILLHTDADIAAATEQIRDHLHPDPNPRFKGRVLSGRLPLAEIDAVARIEDVLWIEPAAGATHTPLIDRVRETTGANRVQGADLNSDPPRYQLGGKGVQIALFDTGVDSAHGDFQGRVIRTTTRGTHGTHVAGLLCGSGLRSETEGGADPRAYRGMAPEAEVASFDIAISSTDYREGVEQYGIDISSNSFVQSVDGQYNIEAVVLDELVRGSAGKPLSIVFAAGNNGTESQYGRIRGYFSTFTSAKNTVSVGAIQVDTLRRSGFSSMGPTLDGRIKPDLVAPGCDTGHSGILSTYPRNRYGRICGTSMAAPVVSGALALLYQAYAETIGLTLKEHVPQPSLARATLIQTAEDLIHTEPADYEPVNPDTGEQVVYHEGPDYATGWGFLNVEAAVELVRDKRFVTLEVSAARLRTDLAFDVAPGQNQLKLTAAWDDLPGLPIAGPDEPKLIHDLDLVLIDPSGREHLPWVLDPLTHERLDGTENGIDPISSEDIRPARRGIDTVNNVEQVVVDLPEAGVWTARLTASSLLEDQLVSLVASVPLGEIKFDFSCEETASIGGRLHCRATLLNRRSDRHPVRASIRFIDDETKESRTTRTVERFVSGSANLTKDLVLVVPEDFEKGTQIRVRIDLVDPESGLPMAAAEDHFVVQ